jgi:hypothetical protein
MIPLQHLKLMGCFNSHGLVVATFGYKRPLKVKIFPFLPTQRYFKLYNLANTIGTVVNSICVLELGGDYPAL